MSVGVRSAVFLLIFFALSWTVEIVAWYDGMRTLAGVNMPLIFQLAAFGPAIAAIVCTLAFEGGRRRSVYALGPTPGGCSR
jgi:hypothetical protein